MHLLATFRFSSNSIVAFKMFSFHSSANIYSNNNKNNFFLKTFNIWLSHALRSASEDDRDQWKAFINMKIFICVFWLYRHVHELNIIVLFIRFLFVSIQFILCCTSFSIEFLLNLFFVHCFINLDCKHRIGEINRN